MMAMSKEQAIADHLSNVRASNMQSAATEAQWTALFAYYFDIDGSATDSDDDADGNADGSGTNTDSDTAGATPMVTDGGGSDSGDERNIDIVDEAAIVMATVNVADDDSAAELVKVQAFSCVSLRRTAVT